MPGIEVEEIDEALIDLQVEEPIRVEMRPNRCGPIGLLGCLMRSSQEQSAAKLGFVSFVLRYVVVVPFIFDLAEFYR